MSAPRTAYNSTLARKPFREGKPRRKKSMGRGKFEQRPRTDTEPLQTSPLQARRRHSITTEKGLIEELDRLTSLIVRKRDGYRCVQCGSTEELTNGHILSRSYYATRWDIHPDGNCHAQCWNCNKAHRWNKKPFMFWFTSTREAGVLSGIRRRAHAGRRLVLRELEEQVKEYRRSLRGMK